MIMTGNIIQTDTLLDRPDTIGRMNRLSTAKRVQIIAALVEGCSIRSTCRMCGASKNTVTKLLADLGTVCAEYHDDMVRGVSSQRVQVNETWSFGGCKGKANNRAAGGEGDVWTWTAIDADSKIIISYLVGIRDVEYATEFVQNIVERLVNRVQLTSDSSKTHLHAVSDAFVDDIDFGQLVKSYGPDRNEPDTRYSPPKCNETKKHVAIGPPDSDHICTSIFERSSLTMLMAMRRFRRLPDAFSKKLETHALAIALHVAHYNFCRVHSILKETPAMKSGLSDHAWSLEDLVVLLEKKEQAMIDSGVMKRGSYKTRVLD